MKKIGLLLFLLGSYTLNAQKMNIVSPDGNIRLMITTTGTGQLLYAVNYKNKPVVLPSSMGIKFKEPAVHLKQFSVVKTDTSTFDETWTPVWGEYASIRNHHKQLSVSLKDKSGSGILLNIVFRIFNEGVGFRYEFPQQEKLNHFIVADEETAFRLTGDHTAHWIPGDYNTNEFVYNHTKLSAVDAKKASDAERSIFAKKFFDKNAVQAPVQLKTANGLYIYLSEAALVNYPAMNLVIDKKTFTLRSHLVPDAVGNKAYLQAPAKTPWRTIIVTDDARELIPANRMILNLNEPSKLQNTSFIKPQKFVGVWWEMHVGKGTWDYAGTQNGSFDIKTVRPTGRHSANNANVKRYIDFAAKHGIEGVLVEGWNVGWEDWFGNWKEDVFDFITPYPDYDVNELVRYAKEKGVKIIMHHETSSSVTNYERWMDTAYRFMRKHNMDAVKTGYVGYIIPRGEWHDGQWMVNHYERVAKKTAEYNIMVDMHESVRLTGLHRTYPNWVASEAARGNEFNAGSAGNPPAHETILPFTRLMGGPMDYTPGIFEIKMNIYNPAKTNQVHTTLAKQLALYVTMYSPLQMAADLPENYEKHLDAFQFIKDVPVDWRDTKVLMAEPGDHLVIARQGKTDGNWYIGAITDENGKTVGLSLSTLGLEANKKYVATIYRDATDAHWQKNPKAYVIDTMNVDSKTVLQLELAPGGGAAISIVETK